jgi:hypothetical protein
MNSLRRKENVTKREDKGKYRTLMDNYLHTRVKNTIQKPTLYITVFQTGVGF